MVWHVKRLANRAGLAMVCLWAGLSIPAAQATQAQSPAQSSKQIQTQTQEQAQEQAQAQAQSPTLTWVVPPLAPAFITDREFLMGYGAATQNWFASHMPDYTHQITYIPLARLLADMKKAETGLRCSATLIPTRERREYIAFAKTVLLHLPVSVIIRASDQHRFAPFLNSDGHIELDKLLSDGKLTTALRIGRSYGNTVDKHVYLYRTTPQVMQIADDTKLMHMLRLRRIDWTLYFPSEAEFYRRRQTPNLAIKAIPIARNTSLLEATIGCADTPEGRKAIAQINRIIDENPTMPWTEFYAEWLGPEDREWFRAARELYLSRKRADRSSQ